jgi:hypothetical protein
VVARLFLVASLLAAAQAPVVRCVPGRAVVEGDGPIPPLTFTLTGGPGQGAQTVRPDGNGRFGVLVPAGGRRIALSQLSQPPGYSVKSFTYGSADLLRDPLMVSASDSSEIVVTFATAPGSWFRVSGRATGIDRSARTYRVTMSGRWPLQSVVQPDGTFSFPQVVRGSYTLELGAPGGIRVSTTAIVADKDVVLNIASPRQREVTGRLAVEGGGRPQISSFSLLLEGSSGTWTVAGIAVSDGMFKIALPEGETLVSVSDLASSAIKSLTYGDIDLLKAPLRVTSTDTAELQLTVAAGTTTGVPGGVLAGINFNNSATCTPGVP